MQVWNSVGSVEDYGADAGWGWHGWHEGRVSGPETLYNTFTLPRA